MSRDTDPVIKISQLKIAYSKQEPVFSIDKLTIHEGEFVLIFGKNGAGKSSFLKTLLRLHPKGSIDAEGTMEIGKGLDFGYMHQRPTSQLLTFAISEEVATPLSFAGVSREERKAQVDQILTKYGWQEKYSHDPRILSSGQQQILNYMVNEAKNAKILLLDEPTSLLDNANTKLVIEFLTELKQAGITIILVSHNFEKFKDLVDLGLEFQLDEVIQYRGDDLQGVFSKPKLPSITSREVPVQITLTNLKVGYREPLLSIDDLVLGPLSPVVLAGKNGLGKTTLLKSLAQQIPALAGEIITSKHKLLFIPQDPYAFFWRSTLRKEWEAYVPKSQIPKGDWNTSPFFLSEGQLKRISLEIAFASEFDVLLLDEPTYALDVDEREWFAEMLQLHDDKLLIVVSNNTEFLELSDQVIDLTPYQLEVSK